VRNKKETIYCYSEQEKKDALAKLGKSAEITRFKGLGEISPDEFSGFIGEDIRLEPILLQEDTSITKILSYYMGKNTMDRQKFIINNLRTEIETVEDELKNSEATVEEAA
jgi:topoisomerase-4 subunit B